MFLKNKNIPYPSFLILCFISTALIAQEPAIEPEAQPDIIEEMVEENEDGFAFDSYLDQLNFYRNHPLNINSATEIELAELRLLSDQQILSLIQYRKIYGELKSIYELQAVYFFDIETIIKILPYVTVSPLTYNYNLNLKNMLTRGRSQYFLRYSQVLEEQKGYTPSDSASSARRYPGSRYRLYSRYKYTYRDMLSFGVTAEKDPGEEFFQGTQKQGFDFYSAHILLKNYGIFKAIALGDYEVNLGQGLVVWSGFGFGKSPEVMNVRKSGYPIKQYTSVQETNFFRGIAANVRVRDIQITVFGSGKAIDANISALDTLENTVREVTSLQATGFHRTPSEIADKNAITQTVFGGNITYDHRLFNVGITAMHTNLSAALERNFAPYNTFEFRGTALTNIGLHYSALFKDVMLFGETAANAGGGAATLNGFLYNLDSKTSVSIVHRYFSRHYHTLFGNAFSEGGKVNNENGIFIGISSTLSQKWKAEFYADFYKFPWLKYQVDAPSRGSEYFAQFTYLPSRYTQFYLRGKYEIKSRNAVGNTSNLDFVTPNHKSGLRLHLSHRPYNNIVLQSRAEFSFFKEDGKGEMEEGFLLYQDLTYSFRKVPLRISGRFAIFETDSYNTRIYTYESDVLYAFSVPALYDKGSRYYLLVNYELNRNLELWLRFSQTHYPDRKVIGTDLDQINGNTRSEVKAQVRVKF